jgi:hypothetical protein
MVELPVGGLVNTDESVGTGVPPMGLAAGDAAGLALGTVVLP